MTPASYSFRSCSLVLLLALSLNHSVSNSPQAAEELVLKEDAESLQFTVNEGSWVSVSMLPDGESFVFDLLGDIYRLDIDGGEAEAITTGMGFDAQPVVSPDGSKIAFISDRDGKDNLWIANIDGSDPIKLSDESYAALISPTWSPDGQYIVVTKRAREIELVQFNIDGGTGVVIEQQDDDGVQRMLRVLVRYFHRMETTCISLKGSVVRIHRWIIFQ